jgi:hypothetical protein
MYRQIMNNWCAGDVEQFITIPWFVKFSRNLVLRNMSELTVTLGPVHYGNSRRYGSLHHPRQKQLLKCDRLS